MSRFISLIILFSLVAAPAFGLSLQERMDLIKQQEQARRAQLQQQHDAAKPKPVAASAKTPASASGPETAGTKTSEPVSKASFQADQLWEGSYQCSSGQPKVKLFIVSSDDNQVVAIFDQESGRAHGQYLMRGRYDAERKLTLQPQQWLKRAKFVQIGISGQLSADGQSMPCDLSGTRCRGLVLKQVSGADAEIQRVVRPVRSALQTEAEQQRQREHYQALVITPQVDEYGIKTLETLKLENEKRLLRPLSADELQRVKNDHENSVNNAIAEKQRQLEAERRLAELKQQAEAAQAKQAAITKEKEQEPLVIFGSLRLADTDIVRKKLREIVVAAGGVYIDPEQLKKESQGLLTIDDPSIDLFDTSGLLAGTSTGTAHFVSVDSMFGTDEVFASFVYELDDPSAFQDYQKKLLDKYGNPSEKASNYLAWSRDSGKSGILLLAQPASNMLEDPTYSLMFMNQENMAKLQKREEFQAKKQNSNF